MRKLKIYACQPLFLVFLHDSHIICVNHEGKMVKEVKMHRFLVCTYKSQDFAQIQENFARSHDRVTVTFRNSGQDTA